MAFGPSFEIIPIVEVPPTQRNPSLEQHRPVILVVDDERIIADTLVAVLCRSGFAAIAAYDGLSALELAAVIPPELLITDIAIPRMNGIQLALALIDAIPDCKVLLFSGHASHIDLIEARKAGFAFPLLAKPVHPAKMLAHVAESLSFQPQVPSPLLG
jgi:DNA-binding NtrC family response regulator